MCLDFHPQWSKCLWNQSDFFFLCLSQGLVYPAGRNSIFLAEVCLCAERCLFWRGSQSSDENQASAGCVIQFLTHLKPLCVWRGCPVLPLCCFSQGFGCHLCCWEPGVRGRQGAEHFCRVNYCPGRFCSWRNSPREKGGNLQEELSWEICWV